ncbi:hypothetical protein ACFOD0_03710 [Shewanella intestini]|uniref:Transcriptional regulator n=1 Tax=Shewanella intestini TaxID=2017544 RepID=A0ABS5I3C4_9GAMM|nr:MULTISPECIES: hypothetical protein [Shewanella]MBR9728528.1 hypothetical protein [Shewanella intestini]MRG36347.1 hypothetical protein [Shewanella sp. XMDDZSB0408]
MSNIIQLLARMGQDSQLQNQAELTTAVNQAQITTELKAALLQQDVHALEKQLDICPDVVCIMVPAEDDKPDENQDKTPESETPQIQLSA